MLRPKSLGFRLLLWFVGLTIGPAAVLAGTAYLLVRSAEHDFVLLHLNEVARTQAGTLHTRLADARRAARLAALSPTTAMGRYRVYTGAAGEDLSGPALEEVRKGGVALLDHSVVVGVPLDGRRTATARLSAAEIGSFFERPTGMAGEGKISLVDAAGARVLGAGGTSTVPPRLKPGAWKANSGRKMLGAWAPVGPWWVAATIDQSAAEAPLDAVVGVLALLGTLFLAVLLAGLYFAGRRMGRSLEEVRDSIRKAGRGEYQEEARATGHGELERLRGDAAAMHRRLAEREGEILRQRQELFCKSCELERMNAETVQADRMKSEFVANMSHEVRTPLHSILTLSGILQDETSGPLTTEQRRQVGIIERNGRALFRMLGDILDFSKIEAGRMTVTVEDVSPGAVLAGVREAIAPLAAEKGLALRLECPEGLPLLRSDPEKLHRAILNLAHNAVKFTAKGSVTLRAEAREEGGATLEVVDTGPGIPAERADRIFEPFHQLDGSSTRHVGGTGLGLAIARNLVRLLGGRIEVHSTPGEGTTFSVHLPAQAPSGQAAARAASYRDEVLLVGGGPAGGPALRSELRAAGFRVAQAVCGRELAGALDRPGLEVLLLDADLLSTENPVALREMAGKLAERSLPTVAFWVDAAQPGGGVLGRVKLSVRGEELVVECENCIAADALELPLQDTRELRKRVAEWIRKNAGKKEPVHSLVRGLVKELDILVGSAQTGGAAGGTRRILLVDPDADARYSVSLQLERLGYEVEAADSLATLPPDFAPDLCLAESALPDATEPVEALRRRFGCPVVVLTADARAEAQAQALAAGAASVLVKPAPLAALLRALTAARREAVA